MITRRNLLAGMAAMLAAPAIVKFDSLMALRSSPLKWGFDLGFDDTTVIQHFYPSNRVIRIYLHEIRLDFSNVMLNYLKLPEPALALA